MKYLIKINREFEVTADSKEEAITQLEEDLARENTTAEVEFWNSCEVVGENEVKFNCGGIELNDLKEVKRLNGCVANNG